MRILVLPIGAALLLLLSACAPAAGNPAATSSAAPSSAPSSAPSRASSTAAINVCSKISLGTVASISGRTVYTTSHEIDGPSQGAKLYSCEYTDTASADDALNALNLVVYRGGDPISIMKALAGAQTSGAKPLAGLGDRAQVGSTEVDVVVGTDVVAAADSLHDSDLANLTTPQLEKLARLVMATL
jgi:hypothetical protein